MELLKKNIHMERRRVEATTQISLEDDLNIPENKPDVNMLNLERAHLVIEEVRPGSDAVNVRGCLHFCLLYQTLEPGSSLVSLEGSIPFEEKMNMHGVASTDIVTVAGNVEDLTVGIINSRKLSIQSVATLNAWVDELYDVEAPIGIYGEEEVEFRKMPFSLAQIAVDKKDVFRMKEEVTLPSNYPNIYQILWSNVTLGDVEFKVLEGKITVQGDVGLFLLYEGEGEEHPIRSYETTIPFSGVLDCYGCRDGMIPDIGFMLGQQELTIRPDFDGEERNIGIDLTMDMDIRVYEEEETELLTDIYGVKGEVEAVAEQVRLQKLLSKVTGKTKVTERIRIANGNAPILQLLHSEGEVLQESQQVVENGILLQGILNVKVLYITGDDETPYAATQAQIPYQYTLEVPGIQTEDVGNVRARLEQLQVTMLDGEEMDVKAILVFDTTVFRAMPMEMIREVNLSALDNAKLMNLPGLVIYTVKKGDSLWSIGQKYYVPVDALRRWNDLESDELMIGQKLLIVKGR
ncbi:MAG: DUF3794 domain-containing protein [Lachnospiraceae bacterium]|nr:DUF3794 domain-containing protein [Lachnospiraceae bacterium]